MTPAAPRTEVPYMAQPAANPQWPPPPQRHRSPEYEELRRAVQRLEQLVIRLEQLEAAEQEEQDRRARAPRRHA